MKKRKQVRPILPPRPKRRKELDEHAAARNPDLFPPIPPRVEDLRGMRAARLKVPKSTRMEIARLMRAARRRHVGPYSYTAELAARELRCEPDDILRMGKAGEIKSIVRGDKMCFSAGEIRSLAKVQRRNSRHCTALEDAAGLR